jgi:hypothetical protein
MQKMTKLILSKPISACAVMLLLSACGVKTYKDLKLNNDTGAKVIETIGKPDAIETMPDDTAMQLWHYYDLSIDLQLTNDTLKAILESSGMEALPGKTGAVGEAAHD